MNCFIILTPDRAEIYSPFRRAWYPLFVPSDEQEALKAAKVELEELAQEDLISEAFKSLIDDLKARGFSLRESLNGLAELAHRESYPDKVGLLLEWASNAAEKIMDKSSFAPADEVFLLETLAECRVKLESALRAAQGYSRLPDLSTAISDALTGIHEAAAVVVDPGNYSE